MSWRTDDSRYGVPMWPRKYLETTTFVAIWVQNFGISTPVCSKTTSPRSLVMTALRVSHSHVSYTSTPGRVKKRSPPIPPPFVSFRVTFGPLALRDRNDCVVMSMDVIAFLLPVQRRPSRGASLATLFANSAGRTGLQPRLRHRRADLQRHLVFA